MEFTTTVDTTKVKASLKTIIFYGLGFWPFKAFWGFHLSTAVVYLSIYTDSYRQIGGILSLVGIMGSTLPFIVGMFSDRANTFLGRRRPFIFFGITFLAITFLFLTSAPTLLVALLFIISLDFFMYFAEGPYLSLLADITPPHQRSSAAGWWAFIGIFGFLFYFNYGGKLWDINPQYTLYLAISMILIGMLALLFGIKEPKKLIKKEKREKKEGINLIGWLKGVFQEREVMKYFLAIFCWWLGYWLVAPWFSKFATTELGVTQGQAISAWKWYSLSPLFLALPLGYLGDRVGGKLLTSFGLWGWIIGFGSLYFVETLDQAKICLFVAGACYSVLLSATHGFALTLFPKERVGEFVGMALLCVSIPKIIGPIITGTIIDTFHNFRYAFILPPMLVLLGFIILQFVHPKEEEAAEVAELEMVEEAGLS